MPTFRRVAGWALLLALLAALGCSSKPPPPAPTNNTAATTVLKIAWPQGVDAGLLHNPGRVWAVRANVRLELTHYDPNADLPAPPDADVWVIPPARMPRWAEAGALLPIPKNQHDSSAYQWRDLLPRYRNPLLLWRDLVYALPVLGDAFVCFYREDLFRQHADAFRRKYGRELRPPASWEEFEEIARFFHRELPDRKDPIPSLPPLGGGDDDIDREFYAAAAPFVRKGERRDAVNPGDSAYFSFHYDGATGEPRIYTPGFVHALRLLQRLQACRPATPAAQPAESFRRGEAVLCLASPTPWIGRFQADGSPVRDKVGVCRGPGSRLFHDYESGQPQPLKEVNYVPYLGANGWVGVVPRQAAQADTAFALLAALSEPKVSCDVVINAEWGGGPFRYAHFGESMSWRSFGLSTKGTGDLKESLRQTYEHPQVSNSVVRLRTPDERAHQRVLVAELRAALLEGKEAAQALQAAAEKWRQLDARKSRQERLAEYNLSLGLRP